MCHYYQPSRLDHEFKLFIHQTRRSARSPHLSSFLKPVPDGALGFCLIMIRVLQFCSQSASKVDMFFFPEMVFCSTQLYRIVI